MRIKRIADLICKKYNTRDPFKLAHELKIYTVFDPLIEVNGYYIYDGHIKMICISNICSEEEQRFICAHELGHAVLHSDINISFFKSKTFYPVEKIEREADKFAIDLLFSDEDMEKYLQLSSPDIAEHLNLPLELVEYRLSVIEKKPMWT